MTDLPSLTEAIQRGDRTEATRLTQEAIDTSATAQTILDALVAGMDDVGRRFKASEVFVPDVLLAARAMKQSMALLEPLLLESGITPEFTAVIGTVEGDLHDVGKSLVAMMWTGARFDVVDLGTNVTPQQFAQAAKDRGARLVGLSALLTTTLPAMKASVQAIRDLELEGVKLVVGGAPVTQAYADRIGADGYAPDAATAVEVARTLVGA